MRRCSKLFSLLLCTALLFTLAACDSNDNDGDDNGGGTTTGEVSIQISGDGVDESLDWNSFFATGTDPETGNTGFVIYFFPGEDFSEGVPYAFISRISARPGTGTYSFADVEADDGDVFADQFGLIGILEQSGQSFELFSSNSGTLTITSSSDDRVEGEFDVEGTFFSTASGQPQEVSVSITGSFEAPGGEFTTPPTN